jgi:hypothetical protein
MLGHVRPRILCEVSAGNRDEVTAILHAASYALYDAESPQAHIAQCAWNTIALPAKVNRHALESA